MSADGLADFGTTWSWYFWDGLIGFPPALATPNAYAVVADLIAREGYNQVLQASDLDGDNTLNQTRIVQCLIDASALIDSYLASRYQLPLAVKPPVLSLHCCALAMYLLTLRPTDQLQARYDATIGWLTKIASGTFQLGIDAAAEEPASNNGAVGYTQTSRVFTQDNLGDYTNFRGSRR